jgi:hypothetical protein
MSRSAWYRAIGAGTLIQIHPLVARLPGTPDTPEQRIIAGVAAVGGRALASHRSAARLWAIPRHDLDPVLRFTYRAITLSPAAVAHRIRAATDRWISAPAPDAA